jgi:hypothetical protein
MYEKQCPIPSWPRWLGAGGALPFLILGVLSWVDWQAQAQVQFALLAYGACILSFVGALHWGFAMTANRLEEAQRSHLYIWSVVPSLVAWFALVLPPAWGVPALVAGLWAHYLQDRRLTARLGLPDWYLPLRLALTGAASLGLLLAWPILV